MPIRTNWPVSLVADRFTAELSRRGLPHAFRAISCFSASSQIASLVFFGRPWSTHSVKAHRAMAEGEGAVALMAVSRRRDFTGVGERDESGLEVEILRLNPESGYGV
jgi:hypothetical protein